MMKLATMIKQLEKHRDKIGKDRDALRDFEAEVENLRETCERAYEDLQCAIEALSEQA